MDIAYTKDGVQHLVVAEENGTYPCACGLDVALAWHLEPDEELGEITRITFDHVTA